jgi:endonuclease IV
MMLASYLINWINKLDIIQESRIFFQRERKNSELFLKNPAVKIKT